ncbi:MAG: multidrug effflux MFS transporter [Burkholderiaceae bacterium]
MLATPPATWLLVLCIAIGPLAMTAAIPANAEIMREFSAPYGVAQTMLTTFLLSMGLTQLFIGFLSDKFGRRPVMLAGLSVFTFGCLLSVFAPSIELLLGSRVIQGIGASAGVSISRAIVRDAYSREQSASVIGYIGMSMIIAPMLGPGMGGFITELASWRYIFVVLACLSLLVLIVVHRKLNETGGESSRHKPKFITSSLKLIRQPAYLGYTASFVFGAGMFYAFQAGAPFLILTVMDRPPSEYGLYLAMPAIGYMTGNFLSGRYTMRVGPDKMIMLAIMPLAVGLTAFWAAADTAHPLALILPMMCLTFSNGLTIPNAMSGALSVRPELAGTAAGLSGFLQAGTGALISFFVGFTQNGHFWPLLAVISICGLMTITGALLGSRHRI